MTLQQALHQIRPVSAEKLAAVQARLDRQTKPRGSLGRLEEFARRFVAITGRESVRAKTIFTFAGDHGVCAEGVSAFPREVTPQMVLNFLAGGAAVNALARHAGAGVTVVDMGVDYDFPAHESLLDRKIARGTANLAQGPAMTRQQALQAIEAGIGVAQSCARIGGIDLVGTGDMGIGNTTPSAAIAAIFTGLPLEAVTHRGTGIDDAGLVRKLDAIRRGLEINRPDPADPVDVLAKVGGFEIGGIAGLVLGCAALGLPVVVDGFISTAGALIASELHPQVRRLHLRRPQVGGDRPHRHARADRSAADPRLADAPRRGDRRGPGDGADRGGPCRPAGDRHLRGRRGQSRERKVKREWDDFRAAGAFLTVFPVARGVAMEPSRLARSMAFFPAVGLALGLLLVVADWLLGLVLPRAVLDALLLLLLIGASGALHLDGIADLIDGLAGGRDREGILRIMKDSRVGALGAVGLVMTLLLKYLSLTNLPLAAKAGALVLMPAAGRWIQVVLAVNCRYLRSEGGTAKVFVEQVGEREMLIATGTLLVAALVLFQLQGILLFFLLAVAAALLIYYFNRRLGGVTGDVLGAATEVIEVLSLLLVLAVSR